MPQKVNWLNISEDDSSSRKRNEPLPWSYYGWAGADDIRARRMGMAQQPFYLTEDQDKALRKYERGSTPVDMGYDSLRATRIGGESAEDEQTPGERFAQTIGDAFSSMIGAEGLRYGVKPNSAAKNTTATEDFIRAAGYGIPQTVADVGGAIADFVTGNTDKNQNYLIQGNRPENYAEYGGMAQTIGSFAPDIALAIGTFGGSMAGQAAMAGSKINALSRLGRLAMGAEGAAPTAIKAFGRAITPAAVRGERVAATLAGALPTALNVAPEVVSGRMSALEGGLQTALGGLGGTLAAGQWGGGRLVNVLSDMAVNMGTQGASEAVTLLPGGAEFDASQAWKNMLYGAGLGTAFGVMNSGKIQGSGERAVFGRKVEPTPTPAEPTATTFTSKPVDIARQTESMLFGGESTLRTDATPEEAAQAMQQMRARSGAELQTLQMDEQGNVRSLSDAYLRGEAQQLYPNVPESVLDNAAATERQVYAQTLAAKYASNPDVLIRALDLDVKPGEITPENAAQVLASRIENEWLVQASNGKGLGNVEQRLAAVGLEGVKSTADVNAPVTGAVRMPDGTIQAPRSSEPTLAEQYETANTGAIILRPASGTTVYQAPARGIEPYNPEGYQPTPVEDIPGERVSAYRTPEGTWVAGPAGPRYLPAQYNEPVTGVASQRISRLPATVTFFPDPNLYRFESTQMGQIPVRTEYTPGQPMEMSPQARLAQMLEQDPQARAQLDQAETLSELTGIPVEEILPEGSPVKDAYVESKQGQATTPQAAETATPVQDVIAGEEQPLAADAPVEAKKEKRIRIVRTAAKNDLEAGILESTVETMPDKTVATVTASPSIDPNNTVLATIGQKIASFVDRLNILGETTPAQAKTNESTVAKLKQFFTGEGVDVVINKPSRGAKSSFFEEVVSDLVGMNVPELRKAIANGQTDFVEGAVRIVKSDAATDAGPDRMLMGTGAIPEKGGTYFVIRGETAVTGGDNYVLSPTAKIADLRDPKLGLDLVGQSLKNTKLLPEQRARLKALWEAADGNITAVDFNDLGMAAAAKSLGYDAVRLVDAQGNASAMYVVNPKKMVQPGDSFRLDGDNNYRVLFTNKDAVANIAEAYHASRNNLDPTVREEVSARREAKTKLDRIYGSSDEFRALFDEETSMSVFDPERPEMATEAATEVIADREAEGESTILADDTKTIEDNISEWRMSWNSALKSATDFVTKALQKTGDYDSLKLNNFIVKSYLIAKAAPGSWQSLGDLYLNRIMTPERLATVEEAINKALLTSRSNPASKAGAARREASLDYRTPVERLFDISANVPDSYFDRMFDTYVPKFAQAQEHAATIAAAAGIQDVRDIWRYVEWQKTGKMPSQKKKLLDMWKQSTGEEVTFNDEVATSIAQKLDKLFMKNGDVYFAYDQLSQYVSAENGAKAFREIMDFNMLGNPKNPLMGLRNLPIMRTATIASVLYALDEHVAEMQDDETYAGIPGSVLKKFLGDGETTKYAMAGIFGVSTKTGAKHGQRSGFRARIGNSMRKTIEAGQRSLDPNYISFARLTAQEQSQRADMFMAEKYPTVKPGSTEYDQTKTQYIEAQLSADLSGAKVSDIFNKLRKTTSSGTVGIAAKFASDINNLGMRSDFVREYILMPYNNMQSQIRQLVKAVEDPINAILPSIIRKYGDNDKFWDAIWRADYEMSALEFTADQMSTRSATLARQEIMDEIKKNYFTKQVAEYESTTTVNGKIVNQTKRGVKDVFNQEEWDDFMSFQRAVNSLRKEDLRSLTAKSLGVNSWKLEEHYGELKIRKDATTETYGSAKAARDLVDEQINALMQERKSIIARSGKAGFDEMMPGYKEQIGMLRKERMQAEANMRQMARELNNIEKRMSRIESLDAMIDKSMSNMYMNRHRDGSTPFVLRLEFDKDTKIPSVRREYTSMSDAELGRAEYLRAAVMMATKDMKSYQNMLAKRTALQDELNTLLQSDETTPEIDTRISSINDELTKMDGFKPVSEMTDAEVMRFAQTNDILGSQKTIQDMRNRRSVRRGSAAAQMVIDQVLASSDVVRAQIVSRTAAEGAINPNYIKGKGNATLTDITNGEVMMYTGKDAPTIDDLAEAIASRVDEPLDMAQLRDMIEKYYTYRDTTKAANGTTIDTVWIDMGALRKAAEAYMDPYVPNLVKRNNWVGYYNPESNWTARQKAAYTVQSLESMQSRIKNYNQQTSLRGAISDAIDWLDKWDINNGLREYVNGLLEYNSPTFNDNVFKTLSEYESQISRVISQGTLFANVGSAIGNRIQGAVMAFSHGMQNASTKYGVRKINADGTKGEIQWMPSELAAQAHVFAKQEQGEVGWRTVEGFKAGGLFSPKQYGFAVAALTFPETTLKYLAKNDGYGKLPQTEQGYWAKVYDSVQRSNLEQGGVIGTYAIREGLKTGTTAQKAAERLTAITNLVEKANNYSSILMAAADAENKFGLTSTDWSILNARQKNDVINQAMTPHKQRLAQSSAAREIIEKEIAKLRESKATLTGEQAASVQRQIDLKIDKLNRIQDETDILTEKLTDYLVFNRGYEQGNWDKISKARFENWILSWPVGGRLAMTMTAPMLRAMNAWQGMFRRAGATEGGTGAKLGRAAAPMMGASILTLLLGGAASTASLPGGVLLADIAYLAEYLYNYMNNDENEKLDKIAPRQTWEKLAADMAAKYGVSEKAAVDFVRAYWSEGLIRYHADLNINAGAGVLDLLTGGTPSGTVITAGKAMYNAAGEVANALGGTGSAYDVVWSLSGALPTSAKRVAQTALNVAPTSWGGQGAVKLDKDGNAIIDPFTGKPRYLSGWDLTKQTFVGKPWTDTRSMLVAREGGTALYTPNDKLAWANDLVATPYVSFGAGLRGKGVKEQSNAALFERDAEQLQPLISRTYRTYKPAIEEGRNFINTMYKNNELIDLGNGEVIPFRQILAEAAMSGVLPETELKGKGAESMRNKLLTYADQWGRSRAAGDAVMEFYQGDVMVKPTGGIDASTPQEFALNKLGEIYARAYKTGLIRRTARQR
jgi:hypothetical protein